jgi:nicotinamide mononucleotide adenylyltransferase
VEGKQVKRYITATLHDNDFHTHLKAGVSYIAQAAKHDLSVSEFKEFLVDFIVYYSAIRVINKLFKQTKEQLEHTRRYVEKNLEVTYTDEKPTMTDENWEYVMHDRVLKYTWAA